MALISYTMALYPIRWPIPWHYILYHGIISYTMELYTIPWHYILYHGNISYTKALHTIPWHHILYHGNIYYTTALYPIPWHYILYHGIISYTIPYRGIISHTMVPYHGIISHNPSLPEKAGLSRFPIRPATFARSAAHAQYSSER